MSAFALLVVANTGIERYRYREDGEVKPKSEYLGPVGSPLRVIGDQIRVGSLAGKILAEWDARLAVNQPSSP